MMLCSHSLQGVSSVCWLMIKTTWTSLKGNANSSVSETRNSAERRQAGASHAGGSLKMAQRLASFPETRRIHSSREWVS